MEVASEAYTSVHPDSATVAGESTANSLPDIPVVPARNRGGAPVRNRNSIKSGLRSFVLGRYPTGCSYVAKQGHLLRRQLREAVCLQDGATSVYSEAVIASACQHEGRRLLLLRWLRIEGDDLPVLDRAMLLDRIGTATNERDKCLRLLRLDQTAGKNGNLQDRLKAILARKAIATSDAGQQGDQTAEPTACDAAAGQPDGDAGGQSPPTDGDAETQLHISPNPPDCA